MHNRRKKKCGGSSGKKRARNFELERMQLFCRGVKGEEITTPRLNENRYTAIDKAAGIEKPNGLGGSSAFPLTNMTINHEI